MMCVWLRDVYYRSDTHLFDCTGLQLRLHGPWCMSFFQLFIPLVDYLIPVTNPTARLAGSHVARFPVMHALLVEMSSGAVRWSG